MAKKIPLKKAPAKAAPKAVKKAAVKAKTKPPVVKTQSIASKVTPKKGVSKSAPKVVAKPATPKKTVKVKIVTKEKVAKVVKASKHSPKAKAPHSPDARVLSQQFVKKPVGNKHLKLTPFLTKQYQRLLDLKDSLLDAMRGVARDNLHSGSETSAFGMHQADAGSDAYDRDFALGMLSKEQGSLYEIDEALKRIEDGSYGVCEICEKPIRHDRLEALPFTRYTVECQAELEKRQHHHSVRPHINSLFGLTEEETESEEEENTEVS